MSVCFVAAVAAAAYGVFHEGPTRVFGVTFPPGMVPVLVFLLLAAGTTSLVLGLGAPACVRCKRRLTQACLHFDPQDRAALLRALDTSSPDALPPALRSVSSEPRLDLDVSYCDECRGVAALSLHLRVRAEPPPEGMAPEPETDRYSQEERPSVTLTGPSAAPWLERVGRS